MYDNKKIKLLRRGNLEVSELGVPSYEYVIIGEYNCDVQPISADKCTKIFGVFPNEFNKVSNISENSLIFIIHSFLQVAQ